MKNDIDTESQFVDKLVVNLNKYFKVEREVWSDCKNGRIDLVISLPDGCRFGVECKCNDKKRGEEIGEFVKQAIRYKDYKFNGVKIPIFIAPPLSYNYFLMNEFTKDIDGEKWHKDRHLETHEHHTVNGFLGSFGVGEIRRCNSFFFLSFSNKIIWSSQKEYKTNIAKGLHKENYAKLLIKLGI